jgi:integrase
MSLYKRGEIWWIYLTYDGQRVRESTHTSDKKKAQAIHDSCKVELKTKKESGKTLSDAFKLWLKHKDRTNSEKSSLQTLLEAYPSRPLSQVNGHDIQDALSHLKASTYNRIANNVRSACNMATVRDWCKPIVIPRKKAISTKLRFLSKTEWICLQKELPNHVKTMAQFAISTGLRQSNVFNLKWSEVDLNRKLAWVDATEAKADKSIPVPLSQYAIDILESQKDKNKTYVFTYKGEPVGSVKTAWNKALIRAKIDLVKTDKKDKHGNHIYKSTFRWHDLRHTWASWHVMNGTPLAVLKELGGWHDISMVMRYAHLSPDHLTKYADNFNVA